MKITSSINKKNLIVAVAIPLVVGGISALITKGGFDSYTNVRKPSLAPAAWVFPVVWTVLYILMGISSYLIYQRYKNEAKRPLTVYAVQLALNFMWPVFFFLLKAYFFAFIWLLVLTAVVTAMTVVFYKSSKAAGLLQIPYLVWLVFAAYLNLMVYVLN